jgi:hypothetical protein
LLQCPQFEIAIWAPAASVETENNWACREQTVQTYVAAAGIGQAKVRRTITCFQCSLRYAGSGQFHIGTDHSVANFRRYVRHEF